MISRVATVPSAGDAEAETKLDIAVIFTSAAATLGALKKAGALAHHLHARITLVVAQVVPYPLSLEDPHIRIDFSERRYRNIAEKSRVDARVRVCLCRDRMEGLLNLLSAKSLVVLAGRDRWWPTRESLLARKLRRVGHEVVFTEME